MDAPRFACDAMLGGLARWLRFAGFDTRFAAGTADAALAAEARAEGRWLLTRDRALASAAGPRVLLLQGAEVEAQVEELRTRLALRADPALFFTRCSACNGVLVEVARLDVSQRVPPYVAAHAGAFRRCPDCDRVYWRGTHSGRIAARLDRLFGIS